MNCIYCGTDARQRPEPCPQCGGPFEKPGGRKSASPPDSAFPLSNIVVWAGVAIALPIILVLMLTAR